MIILCWLYDDDDDFGGSISKCEFVNSFLSLRNNDM